MPPLTTCRVLSPATSLCWAVAAYAVAHATDRIMPMAAGKLVVFLLPLLWLGALGPGRLLDRDAARWVLIAIAGLVWMALVQAFNPQSVDAGWWRWSGRCLALATVLVVATGGIDARTHIRTLGASAALVVAGVLVGGVWMGGRTGWWTILTGSPFGLGNVNVVANTAGPALLAWLALVLAAWWQGRRPRWWEWLALPAGLALHGWIVHSTGRRGAMLALIAAGAWLGLWWLWRWSRRWTIVIVLVAAALAAKPAWNEFQQVRSLLHDSNRMQMYEAAATTVALHPLIGVGEEGALRLAVSPTDAARHMTAAGVKAAHIHCEFLDIALAGGLPALAIYLALLAAAVWRSWQLADTAVAAALQAGGVALVVHLATDNALGFEVTAIFTGMWAGIVLAAPLRASATPCAPPDPWTWMPAARWLLPPLVAVCLWNATWGWTAAFAGSSPDILRTCVQRSRDPEIVHLCATTALDLKEGPYVVRRASVIAAAVGVMGWTDKLAFHAMRERCVNGTPAEAVAATVRYLRFKPFNTEAYKLLHNLLSRHPVLSRDLPQDLLRRVAWIADRPTAPVPDLTPPTTFDEAVDTYAAIHWALIHHPEWPALPVAATALAARWSDIAAIITLQQRVQSETTGKTAK